MNIPLPLTKTIQLKRFFKLICQKYKYFLRYFVSASKRKQLFSYLKYLIVLISIYKDLLTISECTAPLSLLLFFIFLCLLIDFIKKNIFQIYVAVFV